MRKLDAGPVLAARRLSVAPDIAREALRAEMGRVAALLAVEAVPALLAGKLVAVPQDETAATYTRRLRREDAGLDFTQTARVLADRIRALEGWPGSTCLLGDIRLKVGRATAEAGPADTPGVVLAADASGVCVATGDGVLRLLELQRPGGRMLPVAAFLAGFKIVPGTVFASEPMPVLVGPKPLK